MSDDKKVTSLTDFLKRREEEEDTLTCLDQYSCRSDDLILDFDTKLRMVQAKLINAWYADKDLQACDAVRLVNIAIKLMGWVVMPPDIMGNVAVRVTNCPSKLMSVFLYGAPVTRAHHADATKTPLKNSISLCISYIDHEPETVINTGMVFDTSEFVISQDEDNFSSPEIPRTILKHMNTLVLVNGGKGSMAEEEGIYVVFLPHTVSKSIMIAYKHDQPFRLPTDDDEEIEPTDS